MALKVLFDEIVIAKDGVHLSWQVVEVYWLYREMVPRFGGPDFEKGETLTLHGGLRGEIELSSCDATKGITDDHRLPQVPARYMRRLKS